MIVSPSGMATDDTSGLRAALLPALHRRPCEPQREEPDQRRPLAEILRILAVESARVALRLLRRRIALLAALAAPFAGPVHHVSLRPEARAVAEEATRAHEDGLPAWSPFRRAIPEALPRVSNVTWRALR